MVCLSQTRTGNTDLAVMGVSRTNPQQAVLVQLPQACPSQQPQVLALGLVLAKPLLVLILPLPLLPPPLPAKVLRLSGPEVTRIHIIRTTGAVS